MLGNRLCPKCGYKWVEKLTELEDIVYKLARHLANTDNVNVLTWGVKGANLLIELRNLDPETYDKLVKGEINEEKRKIDSCR